MTFIWFWFFFSIVNAFAVSILVWREGELTGEDLGFAFLVIVLGPIGTSGLLYVFFDGFQHQVIWKRKKDD